MLSNYYKHSIKYEQVQKRSLENEWTDFAQMRLPTRLHFVRIIHMKQVYLEDERKRQIVVHITHLCARLQDNLLQM